jgi:hypothetical protein
LHADFAALRRKNEEKSAKAACSFSFPLHLMLFCFHADFADLRRKMKRNLLKLRAAFFFSSVPNALFIFTQISQLYASNLINLI